MSNEVNQKFSASMAIENAQNVMNAEFNKLKKKLKEAEAKARRDDKKLKQFDSLKALVVGGVKFMQPKRTNITLIFAKSELTANQQFSIFSGPIDGAGFRWRLEATNRHDPDFLALCLCSYPPAHFKGPYKLRVNWTFRLLNVIPGKHIEQHSTEKFTRGDHPHNGCGIYMIEIKKLLDPENGFLHGEGTIEVEVDFTVDAATLDHLLVADNEEKEGSGNQKNLNNE